MLEQIKTWIEKLPENVKVVPIENNDIVMDPELRKACVQNYCGHYGKNWQCPPAVGEIDALIDKVRQAGDGILIQSYYQLEDSFDLDTMLRACVDHSKHFVKTLEELEKSFDRSNLLYLNAGHCIECEECSAIEGHDCRHPERAIASVESHGVDVYHTLLNIDLPYNYGTNTVMYVGFILKN